MKDSNATRSIRYNNRQANVSYLLALCPDTSFVFSHPRTASSQKGAPLYTETSSFKEMTEHTSVTPWFRVQNYLNGSARLVDEQVTNASDQLARSLRQLFS